jgi:Holin of 3TMs, for gene-transfer release
MLPLIGTVLSIGDKVIDKLWPNPAERDKAKLELAKLAQDGEFREMELRMQAIIAEAQSPDPWTSRARPSFFYVMYAYILAAIPFGVLAIFAPDAATRLSAGAQAWLAAIPDLLWGVFGTGFLGYGAYRTVEKVKGVTR